MQKMEHVMTVCYICTVRTYRMIYRRIGKNCITHIWKEIETYNKVKKAIKEKEIENEE